MNKKQTSFLKLLFSIAIFALLATIFVMPLMAQDPSTNAVVTGDTSPLSPATTSAITAFFAGLTVKFPWVSTVIMVVGVLRLCMKPIMMIVEAVIKNTPGTADDTALDNFEKGSIYKWLFWGLDLFASIKPPSAANSTANPLIKST